MGFVSGRVDVLHIWYDAGQVLLDGQDGSAGVIDWYLRRTTGADRALIARLDSDDPDAVRDVVVALTVRVKGMVGEDGNELGADTFTDEDFDKVDGRVLVRVMNEIARREGAKSDAVGEPEKPSDS